MVLVISQCCYGCKGNSNNVLAVISNFIVTINTPHSCIIHQTNVLHLIAYFVIYYVVNEYNRSSVIKMIKVRLLTA